MQIESTNPLLVEIDTSLWNKMSPYAQTALSSAEIMLSLNKPLFDYGLAAIGYFKAIEIILEDKIFEGFRNQVLSESRTVAAISSSEYQDKVAGFRRETIQTIRAIFHDPQIPAERKLTLIEDCIRFHEDIEDEYDQNYRLLNYVYQRKSLTLVGMAQILQYLKRVGDETKWGLLWSLKRFIKQHYSNGHKLWSDNKQLAIKIESVALADRNPAAHIEVYSQARAREIRIKILGDRRQEGILISVLKALA